MRKISDANHFVRRGESVQLNRIRDKSSARIGSYRQELFLSISGYEPESLFAGLQF